MSFQWRCAPFSQQLPPDFSVWSAWSERLRRHTVCDSFPYWPPTSVKQKSWTVMVDCVLTPRFYRPVLRHVPSFGGKQEGQNLGQDPDALSREKWEFSLVFCLCAVNIHTASTSLSLFFNPADERDKRSKFIISLARRNIMKKYLRLRNWHIRKEGKRREKKFLLSH